MKFFILNGTPVGIDKAPSKLKDGNNSTISDMLFTLLKNISKITTYMTDVKTPIRKM